MKQKLRFLVVIALSVSTGAAPLRSHEEKKETLGVKLKKAFRSSDADSDTTEETQSRLAFTGHLAN